jgi:hypothetical protein
MALVVLFDASRVWLGGRVGATRSVSPALEASLRTPEVRSAEH